MPGESGFITNCVLACHKGFGASPKGFVEKVIGEWVMGIFAMCERGVSDK